MTLDINAPGSTGLVDRVKNIILKPQDEWNKIAGEPADVAKIYTGYVLPLAVLSALCAFIGTAFIGFMGFRVGIVPGLVGAVLQVVLVLACIFVLALIINALAPTFGSQQDQGQAHKLAAYSATAGLLAGVFMILPPLAMLAIVGIYSWVLLYIGLPRLMKTPEDKRIGYFITIIIVSIVVAIVLNVAMKTVRGFIPGYAMPGAITYSQNAPASVETNVTLPDGTSVNVNQMESALAAAAAAGGGGATAVDPTRLQGFLPQTLPGGFTQTSLSSASAGAMGMNASQAEAEYQRGDARMTVTVVHMGAMGGIASMAGAMNVQESSQDANGYTRTSTVNGRVISEQVNRASNSVTYGVVGRGVALTAEGSGITIDDARAAVDSIGIARVEAVGS